MRTATEVFMRKQLGRYVVVDPEICHGKATFIGTRIMVGPVLDQVARGLAWESIVEIWGGAISEGAITEAVQLAREAFLKEYELAQARLGD